MVVNIKGLHILKISQILLGNLPIWQPLAGALLDAPSVEQQPQLLESPPLLARFALGIASPWKCLTLSPQVLIQLFTSRRI